MYPQTARNVKTQRSVSDSDRLNDRDEPSRVVAATGASLNGVIIP